MPIWKLVVGFFHPIQKSISIEDRLDIEGIGGVFWDRSDMTILVLASKLTWTYACLLVKSIHHERLWGRENMRSDIHLHSCKG
jgi:hypothetical protein